MINQAAENFDPRYMAESVSPPDQPLIAEAMDRIRKVHSLLCEADSATGNLRLRLFGSWRLDAPDALRDDGIKRDLTEAEQLLNLIDHLSKTAANVCENAHALNGKV